MGILSNHPICRTLSLARNVPSPVSGKRVSRRPRSPNFLVTGASCESVILTMLFYFFIFCLSHSAVGYEEQVDSFTGLPCSSSPTQLCSPPISACRTVEVKAEGNLRCAQACQKIACCSGFSYHQETSSCRLALGFCGNSAMRRTALYGLRSCEEIVKCAAGFPNGYYEFLAPSAAKASRATFYCRMDTAVPRTFLPLLHDNYSKYAGSITNQYPRVYRNFTKIALDLQTLQVIRDDFTFASPSTPAQQRSRYGETGSCFNGALYGRMQIDLRGTPFHVHPEMSWEARGYVPLMKNFSISADRKTVFFECDGYCGNCRSKFRGSLDKVVLEWD